MSATNPRSVVIQLGLGLSLLLLLLMTTPSTAGILDATWTAPTMNTDGSPLTDLASYRVYYGTPSSPCPGSSWAQVASPTPSPGPSQSVSFRLTGLATGALYRAAVSAVDASGLESACSTEVSAVARAEFALSPTGPLNFGSVSLGSFAEQTVTLTNTAGGTVSGTASVAAPFSVVSGTPFALAGVGASQAVKVRFTPTMATTVSTNLMIAAGGGTVSAGVTGSGSGGDSIPPTLAITSPTSSATYTTTGSSVTLQGTASDNVGVNQVTWVNSRGGSGTASGTSNWTAAGVGLQLGSNTVTVTARDGAGNTAMATLAVTLSDTAPPTVAVTTPVAGGTVAGAVSVSGRATDNVGVAGVQFKLDGVSLGPEVTVAPYAVTWNTGTTADGSHVLTAVARDTAGNTATAAAISVTVANAAKTDLTPPTISKASLSVGSTGATIGWATSEPTDAQVEYGVTRSYGALAPRDTTLQTSHSQVINGLVTNTWYHFRIRSRDAAGNLGLSGDYRFKTRSR